jgi:segregation and condensation protein A
MTETLIEQEPEVLEHKTAWSVDTDSFEGPLDLLLHLIKQKDLDIYDIPIAQITSEYLEYLEIIKHLNLNNVGDFLVMASILMKIKSHSLLPQEPLEEGEEDAEKLKQDLINRLLEYKKYKESSDFFRDRETRFEGIYGLHQYPVKELGESVDVTLFDLIDAFQGLIKRASKEVKNIITEEISVEEKIRYILDRVEKSGRLELGQIIENPGSIMDIIVSLLAVLELVRTHQIRVIQTVKFSPIFLEVWKV